MADEKEDSPSAASQMPRVRRRAPTIELKATEVAVEPPPAAAADPANSPSEPDNATPPEYSTQPPAYETGEAASAHQPPPPPHDPAWRLFLERPVIEAGLTGGLVAIIIFVVLWLGGMFVGTDHSSDRRLASVESQLREITSRPPERSPEARAVEALAARVAALEKAASRPEGNNQAAPGDEAIKPLQAAIADLTRRIDDNATAIREARGHADAAVTAADAARVATERNNVEALGNRVAALERASKTLTDDVAKSLTAAVAAQALRAAVEHGDPFAAELNAAKAVTADPKPFAPLEAFAAGGLPSATVLARQLSDLAPTMLKATTAPVPAGGFLDRLQANAEKLVRIRPIDEVSGDDPAAVVSRAQAKAARADFAGAVAELKALPANSRAPAEDWIKKVEARNAAVDASRRLVADALAALGKSSP